MMVKHSNVNDDACKIISNSNNVFFTSVSFSVSRFIFSFWNVDSANDVLERWSWLLNDWCLCNIESTQKLETDRRRE